MPNLISITKQKRSASDRDVAEPPAVAGTSGFRNRGFTLIEVMVALIITVLAFNLLTGGLAGSLRIASSTSTWDRAVSTAESHLAAITAPDQMLGETTGQEADGSQWQTRVSLVSGAPAPSTGRKGRWTSGTGLYNVSIQVSWHEGRAEHTIVLNSARLGPLPGSGE